MPAGPSPFTATTRTHAPSCLVIVIRPGAIVVAKAVAKAEADGAGHRDSVRLGLKLELQRAPRAVQPQRLGRRLVAVREELLARLRRHAAVAEREERKARNGLEELVKADASEVLVQQRQLAAGRRTVADAVAAATADATADAAP
eukprot:217105-Chlamydomonas_euryale.AAC.1